MTRKFFIALAAVCTLQANADTQPLDKDSVRSERHIYNKVKTQVANPSPEGVIVSSPWTDNWFVSASAGANAFIGKPLGCDDLFGRIQPTFTVALGKWFTPSVGARLAYNGFAIKDCLQKYNFTLTITNKCGDNCQKHCVFFNFFQVAPDFSTLKA